MPVNQPEPSQGIVAVLGAAIALAGIWFKRRLSSGTVATSSAQQVWDAMRALQLDLHTEIASVRLDYERCEQARLRQEGEITRLLHQVEKLEQQVAALLEKQA